MSQPRTNPSIFARGAVDLGALRPATPPAATGQGQPDADQPRAGLPGTGRPPAAGAVVIDVTEETFQTEVLERSLTVPVIIDFWAEWCQPCKQLSPVLERLAAEAGGAWVLAKIDVDSNQRLAQALRVQSIPMVYGVVKGQLVEGFAGAIPEAQIRQYIDAVLGSAGVATEAPEDPRLAEADEALITGDLDTAEQAYRRVLAERPADAVAESGLAQVTLARRVVGVDPAEALAVAAAKPDDIDAQLLAADVEAISGQAEAAYARLVDLVRRSAAEERESIRQRLVSLFTIAGPDDPAVAAARRALASALF